MKIEEITFYRTCYHCGQPIDITYFNGEFVIKPSGKHYHFFHKDCWLANRKALKNPWTDEKCAEELNKLLQFTKDNLLSITIKRRVTDFLKAHYSNFVIPNHFYSKVLSQVYNGIYKNFNIPVPPEDLYNMWVSKIDVLDKNFAKRKSQGKVKDGMGRIFYDLTILLNNYDSYLVFKERQNLECQEMKEQQHEMTSGVNAAELYEIKVKNNVTTNTKDLSIDSIVDDIF